MMRVFLDANVLFTAAHNSEGKAAFIIELGFQGYVSLFTSDVAYEEAKRNLEVKFPHCIPRLKEFITGITFFMADRTAFYPAELPKKDSIIFQAAVACNATHFLTGDFRHFGPFMNRPEFTNSIIIQTASDFLSSL